MKHQKEADLINQLPIPSHIESGVNKYQEAIEKLFLANKEISETFTLKKFEDEIKKSKVEAKK